MLGLRQSHPGKSLSVSIPHRCRTLTDIDAEQVPDPAGFFVDLDTFILHMTVKTAPRSPDESPLESERCVVLGQYQGHPRDWSAPDWMKLHGQGTKVFRDSVEAVINLMQCPAPLVPEQTTVSTQYLSVRVPWLIGALTRLV